MLKQPGADGDGGDNGACHHVAQRGSAREEIATLAGGR